MLASLTKCLPRIPKSINGDVTASVSEAKYANAFVHNATGDGCPNFGGISEIISGRRVSSTEEQQTVGVALRKNHCGLLRLQQ